MGKQQGEKIDDNERPVLIFDKDGEIGSLFIENLTKKSPVVFVSRKAPDEKNNLVYIHLSKRIPAIPNAVYSTYYLIYNNDSAFFDLLPSFIQKAKEGSAKIYCMLTIRQASEQLLKTIHSFSSRIIVLLIGDVFGEHITLENPITKLIKQAEKGSVLIANNGLSLVYPVAEEDVVRVVNENDFVNNLIYVLPPYPVTELALAHALIKKEPFLKLDFENTKEKEKGYLIKEYQSVFNKTYNYKKHLPQLKIRRETSNKGNKSKKNFKLNFPWKRYVITTILITTFVLFFLPLMTTLMGIVYLDRCQSSLESGDFGKAKVAASTAKTLFNLANNSSLIFIKLKQGGIKQPSEMIISGVNTGEKGAKILEEGISGVMILQKAISEDTANPKREFLKGSNNLKDALTRLFALRAEGNLPKRYQEKLDSLEPINKIAGAIFDLLPNLFGFEGKKQYLLLFQNNMELRPGGGFIGSYGLLTVENGKIKDLQIQDVYDADGQLKDHYEPPYQLQRYSKATHWFLRDSNFNVDFPKSAADAAFFYEVEMGQKVDGVIALDTIFIRNLLQAVGPLNVSGYNEKVTADNFFLLTEQHSEDNFFPGSTQKKDFLNAVYNSLFVYTTEIKKVSYLSLAKAVINSIKQKHLLFAFSDDGFQKVFSINDLSSSLEDFREKKDGKVNDFIGINEANIGGNKVNYFLDRSIKHEVNLNKNGFITEILTIDYNNRSTAKDKYGGDYKNYFRLILPQDAGLQSILIDNQVQATTEMITDPAVFNSKRFVPTDGLEVERSEESGKTIYGFLLNIPMSGKKTLMIHYSIPYKIFNVDFTPVYSLKVFKQPGTDADPYRLTIKYPTPYKLLSSSPGLETNSGKINLLTTLLEDREVDLTFSK